MSPSQAAKLNAAPTVIASPGRVPKLPASAVAAPINVMATVSITTWARTFSHATRRRLIGSARRKSRLPRRLSPASVAERARIDHSPVTRGRKPPYLYWM